MTQEQPRKTHALFRVGVDARALDPSFKAHFGRGTGRYAQALLSALERQVRSDASIGITRCTTDTLIPTGALSSVLNSLPIGRTTLSTQCVLPLTLRSLGVDAMHFLAHGDAPSFMPLPYLVTVLDLIPMKFPQLYAAKTINWRYHFARFLESRAIRKATGIVTISECSKRDIVTLLGFPEQRVVVTPLGVDDEYLAFNEPAARYEQEQILQKLQIPTNTQNLLYVGGIDARKNVSFLLSVMSELVRSSQSDVRLVVAGRIQKDEHYPKFRQQITQLGLTPFVQELGFISDDTLRDLYRAVDLLVFPSLYEGFGLPVLEALACGTWVVAGNNSALPEVMGSVGSLLPDNDQTAWVRAIQEWFRLSPDMQAAQRRLAVKHAKQFTWDRTAAKTLDAYRLFFRLSNP